VALKPLIFAAVLAGFGLSWMALVAVRVASCPKESISVSAVLMPECTRANEASAVRTLAE
jgi:hypothetical protein